MDRKYDRMAKNLSTSRSSGREKRRPKAITNRSGFHPEAFMITPDDVDYSANKYKKLHKTFADKRTY